MGKDSARIRLAVLVLLAALALLIYHRVVFRPGIIWGQDTLVQGYPLNWYSKEMVAGGLAPGWFPYMMSGFPIIDAHVFYPTDFLTWLMPVTRAVTWRYILHTILAAWLMYLMLRGFGRSAAGSIVGGMAFGFSAFFISKVHAGHGWAIWSGTWIPLTLLLLDRTIETRRARYAVLAGASLGLQILGRHPQYVYYTALAALLLVAWRVPSIIVKERRPRLALAYLALGVLAIAFAATISAHYLLPFLQLAALSNRSSGTSYEFASSLSLAPAQLMTALVPSFWGSPARDNSAFGALYWDGALYIGVAPLILSAIAVIWARGAYAGYMKALALLAVLIALGNHTPVFRLIYEIPGFDMARAPSKILFLYTFAMAGLAAYGFDTLISSVSRLLARRSTVPTDLAPTRPSPRARRMESVFACSSLALILVLVIWTAGRGPILAAAERAIYATRADPVSAVAKLQGLYLLQRSSLITAAALAAAGTLVVACLIRGRLSRRAASGVLVALTFVDLWMYATPLLYTVNARKLYASSDRRAIDLIRADRDWFRILPMDTRAFQYAQGVFDGIESVNGYYPVSLARYAAYVGAIGGGRPYVSVNADIDRHDSPLVALLGVKYVLSSEPLAGAHLAEVYSGRTHLYRNRNCLPRVFTVHDARVVRGPEDSLRAVRKPDFDARRTVILESGTLPPRGTGDASRDRVRVTSRSANRLNILVDMASPGYLFLSEVYYPSWRAWVDGGRTRIFPANYLFRAVYLPRGRHEVMMEYADVRYRLGVALFIVAALCAVWVLVRDRA